MQRSGSTAKNDASLRRLRLYTFVAFTCLFLLLMGVLLANILIYNGLIDTLYQTYAAGRRLDLTTHATTIVGDFRVLGSYPFMPSIIPDFNSVDLHKALKEHAQLLWDLHMSLLLGGGRVKATTDEMNERLIMTPNVVVTDYNPSVLTYHAAVRRFGMLSYT